ncbi:MAG TPA: hypothetical protein VER58_18580 [Thermoanaerobaculia bacterium]|nr:hypothetical protein [Thermoanaerobaculia bacterium]
MESPVIFLIPIVAIGGSFAMVVAVVWLVTRAKQRAAQYRAEVQLKMIDRFGSGTEFVNFLESPAGRQFLQEPRRSARERVLGGVRAGIILLFLGCAFAFGYVAEHDPGFFIPAFILGGLGVGFLVSAAISWKLTEKWEPTQQPPAST